jgi:hypothetical protein
MRGGVEDRVTWAQLLITWWVFSLSVTFIDVPVTVHFLLRPLEGVYGLARVLTGLLLLWLVVLPKALLGAALSGVLMGIPLSLMRRRMRQSGTAAWIFAGALAGALVGVVPPFVSPWFRHSADAGLFEPWRLAATGASGTVGGALTGWWYRRTQLRE